MSKTRTKRVSTGCLTHPPMMATGIAEVEPPPHPNSTPKAVACSFFWQQNIIIVRKRRL